MAFAVAFAIGMDLRAVLLHCKNSHLELLGAYVANYIRSAEQPWSQRQKLYVLEVSIAEPLIARLLTLRVHKLQSKPKVTARIC
jgi:hypothetical protein